MTVGDADFKNDLIAAIPRLRAFAISLSGNVDRADDLVQETLVKAWSSSHSFTAGTNLRAWLFTILRNAYFSELRKRQRETEDVDGAHAAQLTSQPSQIAAVELGEFQSALNELPADQREALILIGAAGFAYEEAAEICGCAVGTIKSRVNRARARLSKALQLEVENGKGGEPEESGSPTHRLAALPCVPL